jgi:hypothetical protein
MQITVFTSNQPRHSALIEALAGVAERIYAVQECNTVYPGRVADFFRKSEVMQRYFERVIAAERAVFGQSRFAETPADGKQLPRTAAPRSSKPVDRGEIRQLPIRMGDLNLLELAELGPALESNLFIVFGTSFIRGELCRFLVERAAVNIHMGVSPQYRGSSCNFWALYDRRPELVGATIHRLSAGLDSGPMLLHAFPPVEAADGFALGMKAVQAAHTALLAAIADGSLGAMTPVPQDKSLQIRYTRNADFTDAVAAEYLDRCQTPAEIVERLRTRDNSEYLLTRAPLGRRPTTPASRDRETPAMRRSASAAARR